MTNPIDKRAVVLAETALCGDEAAENDLKRILTTVGISEFAHQEIELRLGSEGYRRIVS